MTFLNVDNATEVQRLVDVWQVGDLLRECVCVCVWRSLASVSDALAWQCPA